MAATQARMLQPGPAFDAVYAAVRSALPAAENDALQAFRDDQFARFKRDGLPGPKSEAWKYTPLAGFNRLGLVAPRAAPVDRGRLDAYRVEGAVHLVFVNGLFSADLSDSIPAERGLHVAPLSQALGTGSPDAFLTALRNPDEGRGLSALNVALASDGVRIQVDRGVAVDRPLHIVFVNIPTDAGPPLVNLHNAIDLAEDARLDLLETHLFLDPGDTATNLVNRIVLAEGAHLKHDRLQVGDASGTLLGRAVCEVSSGARLVQSVATLGGGLVRNEIATTLRGRGAEALFNGLYLGRGRQHQDNTLQIEHAAPGCHSDQFYKGVLDEQAHAVFAGRIMVHRIAQQTNAYQANNNLLLSPDVAIDTKPELEIFADDVKCSHGATAGDLDERELFYLRSRGIPPAIARSLLTFAFTGEVLDRFSLEAAKALVRREIVTWLPDGESPLEWA